MRSLQQAQAQDIHLPKMGLVHQCVTGSGIGVRYQPIFNVDRQISGVEALARMQGEGSFLPMSDLINQVRDAGLLPAFGRHVHRRALSEFGELAPDGESNLRLSLNASAVELCSPQFVPTLLHSIDAALIAPTRVMVELTEDMTIPDIGVATRAINVLQDAGVSVSLDDFGTGANGFVAMRRLPINQIKLDRSLVHDAIEQDILVAGIISIAHDMGIEVVAEGIEEDAQIDRLTELGCDLFQGYLLGRPAPLDLAVSA